MCPKSSYSETETHTFEAHVMSHSEGNAGLQPSHGHGDMFLAHGPIGKVGCHNSHRVLAPLWLVSHAPTRHVRGQVECWTLGGHP